MVQVGCRVVNASWVDGLRLTNDESRTGECVKLGAARIIEGSWFQASNFIVHRKN